MKKQCWLILVMMVSSLSWVNNLDAAPLIASDVSAQDSKWHRATLTDVKEVWSSIVLDRSSDKLNIQALGLFSFDKSNMLVIGTTGNGSAIVSIDTVGHQNKATVMRAGGPADSSFLATYLRSNSESVDIYGSKGIDNFVVVGPFVLSHLKWSNSGDLSEVKHDMIMGSEHFFSPFSCMNIVGDQLCCVNAILDTVVITNSRLSDDLLLSQNKIIGTMSNVNSVSIQQTSSSNKYLLVSCNDKGSPSVLQWLVIRLDSSNHEQSRYIIPTLYGNRAKICATDSGWS